jgi:5-methylcytosine-specific restriction endonuclease McrBC regulatory subunit McrC
MDLQPDLILRRQGSIRAVLDAKWKRPGPDTADLHQILAYAAVTEASHVGLVYPGRNSARRELQINDRLRVSLYRLRVIGTAAECRTSVARLARSVCRF